MNRSADVLLTLGWVAEQMLVNKQLLKFQSFNFDFEMILQYLDTTQEYIRFVSE